MNNVKTSSKKMIKGFMCRSPAATAVCMTGDGRSVIVPTRRPTRIVLDSTRLINGANYSHSKHVECTRLGACRRPIFVPPGMLVKREHHDPKSLPPSDNNVFQVVVMRVSLHCQGCAGKVKKHLSKMEGVTSYSIELESKRVTVMGHVSPAGVLESVSKVKRAEFWPC